MLPIDIPAIDIPARQFFDQEKQEFIYQPEEHYPPAHLVLEHSLMSIRKWEAIWHKPFLSDLKMKTEEFVDYVRCMTVNQQKDPDVYNRLRPDDVKKILDYMQDPMSARTFWQPKKKKGKEKPNTAEDYYHAMAFYGIPFDCEKWHFNQLVALIKTCEDKGGGEGPKMTYREQQRFYNELNDARCKKLGTKG